MSNCNRCFEVHKSSQLSFPLKPVYYNDPVVTIDQEALQRQGIKKFTTNVLTELNRVYTNQASTSFIDAVTANSSTLEKRKGYRVRRKEKINMQRELTKKVNKHFADTAAITLLTEGESKRKYHRKQSFCTPQEQAAATKEKALSRFLKGDLGQGKVT